MNIINKRGLLSLFILAGVLLFASEVLASEGISSGRKLWDNIMLFFNFGILVFLFIKYARKPLMAFLHGEKSKVEEKVGSVETKLEQTTASMNQELSKLNDIEPQLENIRDNIIRTGQREKELIVEEAKQNAERIISQAKDRADYKLASIRKALKDEMVDIAVTLVENRLHKALTLEDNTKVVNQFISDLSQSSMNLN